MITVRCLIDDKVLQEARAMVAKGETADHIFADREAKGLRLRVRGRNASWELKYGAHTLCIAQMNRMFEKEARSRARVGRDLLAGGVDPKPFFSARLAGLSEMQAKLVAHEKHGSLPKPNKETGPVWTLDELMQRYVVEYVAQPKRRKNKPLKPPSEYTVKDARTAFAQPAFDPIRRKTLGELDKVQLEAAAAQIEEDSGARQREKAVTYVRAAFTWARELDPRPAGLETPWWREWKNPPADLVRPQNTLLLEELGYLLAIAESNRVAPGRSIDRETSEVTLCMLWWIILTAQRTTASSLVLRRHVTKHRQRRWEGWGVVSYPAENMKSRRFHAVPLPPLAMAIAERAKSAAETMGRSDSQWLFPSIKTVNSDKVKADLRTTDRAVSQLIRRLRGQDKKGLEVGAVDLLGDLPHFSPHNIRHSFGTAMGNAGVPGSSISAVFDHSAPVSGDEEYRRSSMLDVYDKSHSLHFKARVLSQWCFRVYRHYEKALESLILNNSGYAALRPWRFSLPDNVLLKPWENDDDGFSEMR